MKRFDPRILIGLLAACLPVASQSAAPRPPEPDWVAVVGTFPQTGSFQLLEEHAILKWLQHVRTSTDVARVQSEGTPSLGCFGGVLRRTFAAADYPLTTAVLTQARQDLMPLLTDLQNRFARPMPYATFPDLDPAVPGHEGFSFPSRNATLGVLYARILAQLDPAHRDVLDEKGNILGDDRVLGGAHWPSDAVAGQKLGRAFATWWISDPDHRRLIQRACGEEWRQRP